MTRRLLATDLDGTFIGDDAAMTRLWADLEAAGILVVFATGRHLPSIDRFLADHEVARRADACVCMVGTEIWLPGDGGYVLDDSWSEQISHGWDRNAVAATLADIAGVTPQPLEWQSPFKSSYYVEYDGDAVVTRVRRELGARGLQATVVYSARRYLDLLPHRAGKGSAVAWLAETLGIQPVDVITAGDTGNDLDMMRPELGFRCIAVGNASAELRDVRDAHLYHATAPYAAGIREGLEYHGWLER